MAYMVMNRKRKVSNKKREREKKTDPVTYVIASDGGQVESDGLENFEGRRGRIGFDTHHRDCIVGHSRLERKQLVVGHRQTIMPPLKIAMK